MTVRIFTKTNCPSCKNTKDMMDTLGIEYNVRNIEDDDSNFQEVLDLGYTQVPVIVVGLDGDDSWSGHQPSRIMQLKNR